MLPFGIKLPLPEALDMTKYPVRFVLTQLVLAIPVLIAGRSFYLGGLRHLFAGAPNMDTLVAIGTGSAFVYSLYSTWRVLQGDVSFVHSIYYESATMAVSYTHLFAQKDYRQALAEFEAMAQGRAGEDAPCRA